MIRGKRKKGECRVGAGPVPPFRTFPSADYADYADCRVRCSSSGICGSPQNASMQFVPTMRDCELRPGLLAAPSICVGSRWAIDHSRPSTKSAKEHEAVFIRHPSAFRPSTVCLWANLRSLLTTWDRIATIPSVVCALIREGPQSAPEELTSLGKAMK